MTVISQVVWSCQKVHQIIQILALIGAARNVYRGNSRPIILAKDLNICLYHDIYQSSSDATIFSNLHKQ